jgi:hypothetical protein
MTRGYVTRAVLLGCLSTLTSTSFGQVGFSRSCRFDDIPGLLRTPFLILTDIVGAAPVGTFDYLRTASVSTLRKHYIFESLTVDYFNVRYALYAENQVYILYCPSGTQVANSSCTYRVQYSFKSKAEDSSSPNGWAANVLNNTTIADVRLSIFFQNRAFLYSARAGHPNLIQDLRGLDASNSGNDFFVNPITVGNHFFTNQSGVLQPLGKTVARDCNLTEWGFGQR